MDHMLHHCQAPSRLNLEGAYHFIRNDYLKFFQNLGIIKI